MDIAYLHVVINHLPIMGVPIVLGLLLLPLMTRIGVSGSGPPPPRVSGEVPSRPD